MRSRYGIGAGAALMVSTAAMAPAALTGPSPDPLRLVGPLAVGVAVGFAAYTSAEKARDSEDPRRMRTATALGSLALAATLVFAAMTSMLAAAHSWQHPFVVVVALFGIAGLGLYVALLAQLPALTAHSVATGNSRPGLPAEPGTPAPRQTVPLTSSVAAARPALPYRAI